MTDHLTTIAAVLVASLPIVAIAVIGLVLSRSKLPKSHTKAKRLATIGFGLLAIQALGGEAVRRYIVAVAASSGDRIAMTNNFTIVGLVTYVLLAVALVLLMLAIIADRNVSESSRGAI
jgi:O-acetylhomoserine/O-acetylserine sulfhydrylase-like pyridoxal-dependent enzyme